MITSNIHSIIVWLIALLVVIVLMRRQIKKSGQRFAKKPSRQDLTEIVVREREKLASMGNAKGVVKDDKPS